MGEPTPVMARRRFLARSRRVLRRVWIGGGALIAGSLACSSSHMDPPAPDPEALSAQRAARAQAQARAAEQAQFEAAQARELERAVQGIEGSETALDTAQVEQVLAYHCGECHAPLGSPAPAVDGLFFERFQELIEAGKVIPGDAAQSRLLLRMQLGEMPPAWSSAPPIPAPTVARIAAFIDALPPPLPAAPPAQVEPPWLAEARNRPDVPPLEAPCFEYLGDWIRCEGAGNSPEVVDVPGRDLSRCLEACSERDDCVAVTDYTWLGIDEPYLGCSLYLSSCAAPGTGVWHEEDGGRQYLKVCGAE
ncbi:MAG TPA: hypothetical protein VJU61_25320 [Polyangiaceae bacterium]|nr:hypothetical protein [Polyangiaceae bacterium]